MDFIKPPLSIEKQVALLRSRGLIFNDDEVIKYLEHISYYHLSAYFKYFQNDDNSFYKNVTFDAIKKTYIFDRKLRLLLLDILERVEKSFKCQLIYRTSLSTKDPHWIAKSEYFSNAEDYSRYIEERILQDIPNKKDESIRHYYKKYSSPGYPPAWIIIECLTFGQCVTVYRFLNIEYKKEIALFYGVNYKFIESWLYGLSIIRNICAHHSWLWNRDLSTPIKINSKKYKEYFSYQQKQRLYNYLVSLQIMMSKINPSSEWIDKLSLLIAEYGMNDEVMGFPADWKDKLRDIANIR